jgi:hypothetical protein
VRNFNRRPGKEAVANRKIGALRFAKSAVWVGALAVLGLILLKLFCRSTTEASELSPSASYVATLEQEAALEI